MHIDDDDIERARLWDEDEQARDIAELAIASLQEHVDLEAPAWKRRRVLDVGCGTGLLTAELAPFVGRVVAVDKSPGMIAVLQDKQLANVDARCANIEDDEPPWLGCFDLIVASCVCGALPSYPKTMRRLADALNPGGLFAQWDWLRTDDDQDGLTLDDVRRELDGVGLSLVHVDHEFDGLFDEEPLLMALALKMVIIG